MAFNAEHHANLKYWPQVLNEIQREEHPWADGGRNNTSVYARGYFIFNTNACITW